MVWSGTGRRLLALAMAALVVLPAGGPGVFGVAHAADPGPRLLILPFSAGTGATEEAASHLAEQVAQAVGRSSWLKVASPGSTSPIDLASAAREADRVIAQAKEEAAELRFEEAAVTLRRAVDLLTGSVLSLDVGTLLEAYLLLAVASFRMGDERGAQAALFSVARLDSEYRLADGYPPIFVREFEKARRRTEKALKGSISVEGPPGATVFINGKDLGMVPVLEDELVLGPHYLRVEGRPGEVFAQVVDVKVGVTRVRAAFGAAAVGAKALAGASVGPVLNAASVDRARAATAEAGAELALVGAVYKDGAGALLLSPALFSVRHQGFTALGARPLATPDAVSALAGEIAGQARAFGPLAALPLNLADARYQTARKVDRRKASEGEVTLVLPERGEEGNLRALSGTAGPEDVGGEVLRPQRGAPWWVWALAGAGIVAVAGGTYYGISEGSRPVTGTVSATW
jgi:hypothetical protein